MAKEKSKPKAEAEVLVLRPGYSFVDPVSRVAISSEDGFRVSADDPRVEIQKHKFWPLEVAIAHGIRTEVEEPEVTKADEIEKKEDPLGGF